jgi:hypothetical protein
VGTTGIPVVLATRDHVFVAFNKLTVDLTQPVGGKVTASNLSEKGNAAAAGAAITVKVELKLLFDEFKSDPPFGELTQTEKV